MAKDDKRTDDTEEQDPAEYSLEDRVKHLETIQHAYLTAHGETYNGATAHRETLGAIIDAHH